MNDPYDTWPVRTIRTVDGEYDLPVAIGVDGKTHPAYHYDTVGRDELIRRLRGGGASMRRIAADVGCSVGTVHRVLTP